jgi:hypothetical protein
MNIIEAIEGRRSVKHYDAQHVMPEADVQKLLQLAEQDGRNFNHAALRSASPHHKVPGYPEHLDLAANRVAALSARSTASR